MQPTFDHHRSAFGQVFACQFGQSRPQGDLDVGRIFLTFVGDLVGIRPIDRQADLRHSRATREVFHFRIAGQVPDQNHTIEVGHVVLPRAKIPQRGG